MARTVDVKQQNWARWECDVVAPGAEMLAKICRIHACSADWLLGLPKAAAESAAHSAAQSAAPGELPACAKCPFKEKVKAFEALARKPPGGH